MGFRVKLRLSKGVSFGLCFGPETSFKCWKAELLWLPALSPRPQSLYSFLPVRWPWTTSQLKGQQLTDTDPEGYTPEFPHPWISSEFFIWPQCMRYFGSFSWSLSSEPKGGFCHSGKEPNCSAHHAHEAPWTAVPSPLLLSPVSRPVLHKCCKPASQALSHFRTFALTAPQPRLGSTLISALHSDFF